MKRAIRRHHRERLKRARKFWWGRENTPEQAARAVDTPTPCSCAGCRNPRTSLFSSGWTRLSVAERRFRCEADDET